MMKKLLVMTVLLALILGCQTASIRQADVDMASKIYFIPLNVYEMNAEMTVVEPAEEPEGTSDAPTIGPSQDIRTTLGAGMMPAKDFETINKAHFDRMKEIFGSKLEMVPDSFRMKKKVMGAEVDTWDFDNLDCDIYIVLELESSGALRDARYSIGDDDYSKDSFYASPMVPDLKLKIYRVVPGGKPEKLFQEKHIILGYHEMVIGGEIDMESALEQKMAGEEVEETAYAEVPATDYFHWMGEYRTDRMRLQKDFEIYSAYMGRVMLMRAVEEAPDIFAEELQESLAAVD